jgi:hypothetical protein
MANILTTPTQGCNSAARPPSIPSHQSSDSSGDAGVVDPQRANSGIFDRNGRQIVADDLVLHGDSYFTVSLIDGQFYLAFDYGFERLDQAWCECGVIVGNGGTLQVP